MPIMGAQADSLKPATPTGITGLNVIPNARMQPNNSLYAGVTDSSPFVHGFIGVQIAQPLQIVLRQTAKTDNILEDPKAYYPGADIKLRLKEETRSVPAIAVGLQSMIGHKRMSGEYISLSKRYQNWDLTAGLGWGRYGTAGHFKNPLKALNKHFGKHRALSGDDPVRPSDWFTGEDIGFFAGFEYTVFPDRLSILADYGADRYEAEFTNSEIKERPPPWALGLSGNPFPWLNLSAATQGFETIIARMTIGADPGTFKPFSKKPDKPLKMKAHRSPGANVAAAQSYVSSYGVMLQSPALENTTASATLILDRHQTSPAQIRKAAIALANNSPENIETLSIQTAFQGLQGPEVTLLRRDLEQAITHDNASAEELWRNAEINPPSSKTFLPKRRRSAEVHFDKQFYELNLEQIVSLGEEDHGILSRTSLIAVMRGIDLFGFLDQSNALRLDVYNNVDELNTFRRRAPLPVRSNIDDFSETRLSVDHSYTQFTHSFTGNIHSSLMAGYLEELYAGLGGEIIYAPFQSRFALGAEAWQVFKRHPGTFLDLGLNGDHVLSGHTNLWYDIPRHDVTLKLSAGRYLAEDIGGSLSLKKSFLNGVSIEGFTTITNRIDADLFGSENHTHHGLRMNIPIGTPLHKDLHHSADIALRTIGRDSGQKLQKPFDLYEATRPLTYKHYQDHWQNVIEKKPPH